MMMLISIVVLVVCATYTAGSTTPYSGDWTMAAPSKTSYSSDGAYTAGSALPYSGDWGTTFAPKTRQNRLFYPASEQTFPGSYPIGGASGYSKSFVIPQTAQPSALSMGYSSAFAPHGGEYPTVGSNGYLKDTPEVAQAKAAHFAEKIKIINDQQQYSSSDMAAAPQYYSAPQAAASMLDTSGYTASMKSAYSSPVSGGVGTFQKYSAPFAGSSYHSNGFSSAGLENPTAFSQTLGRQKRSIPAFTLFPLHEPDFHPLPTPFALPLPHPALPLPAFHSLPLIHHPEPFIHPTVYSSSSCSAL